MKFVSALHSARRSLRRTPLRLVSMVAIMATCAMGCGSQEHAGATATGTVTVDGQPLDSGLVQLYPIAEGRPAFANVQSDGSFAVATTAGISGVSPGTYKVAVQYESEEGELPFAEKYTTASESGIQVTVDESGDNVFAIELSGPEK